MKKMRTGLISKVSSHLIKVACEVVVGKRDKLTINGGDYATPDGTAIRDYIHVSDLAEIHLISAKHLIKGGESNLFNCGYGNGFSIKDVINELNKIIDKNIKTSIGPRRPGDSEIIVSNVEKFMNYFFVETKLQ